MGELSAARPYLERALAIREQVLSPIHPDTATSLNSLGVLLQTMGALQAARSYYERALTIAEVALGINDPTTVLYRENYHRLLQQLNEQQ